MRIIFLHHAGGDHYAYKKFKPLLEESNWEGVYYDLPGHGNRFNEPLSSNIFEIVDEMYESLIPYFEGDYAIFGTSFGTLIGYILCQKILKHDLPLPKHLFFTSRRYPSSHLEIPRIANLPEEEFWKSINKYGGCPPALIKNKELRAVYEPLLRADFRAIEGYRRDDGPKLDIKATILFGRDDYLTYESMKEWQDYFIPEIDIVECEGGHFFCYTHADKMVEIMKVKMSKGI